MNRNRFFDKREVIQILTKVDISKLSWSGAHFTSNIYAGSAPLATDLGLTGFFRK